MDAEKIKYVLNGNVRYYTRDELAKYYKALLQKNNTYHPEHFDSEVEHLIETLSKYDGDPYGFLPIEESRKIRHTLEEQGIMVINRSRG